MQNKQSKPNKYEITLEKRVAIDKETGLKLLQYNKNFPDYKIMDIIIKRICGDFAPASTKSKKINKLLDKLAEEVLYDQKTSKLYKEVK